MSTEPESSAGALAPRAEAGALSEQQRLTLHGGVGLFDHAARDAVSPSAGLIAGVLGLLLTVGFAAVLFNMSPALLSGKAGGTANQLGAAAAAGPSQLAPGSPEAKGAQIIASKPCGGCHTIPGVAGATGAVGPNLGGLASRAKIAGGAVPNSGPDDLKKWIGDPAGTKPGTAMPKVPLTDEELTDIVAFLETLK